MTGWSPWVHALIVVLCLPGVNCTEEHHPMHCGDGVQFQDQCYWFSSETAGWYQAVKACHQHGPKVQLAVISNQQQQDWLHSTLPYNDLWIGLHDTPKEGHWMTVDGIYPNYTNWASSHPTDSSNKNCAMMSHEGGYWMEQPCKSQRRYVCSSTSEGPFCHSGGVLFRGHCYWQPELGTMTWSAGQDACAAIDDGVQMVIIRDGELNTFLSRWLRHVVWIGLHDRVNEGQWEWVDGSRPTFTNWEPNRPDNLRDLEDCGVFRFQSADWNDIACGSQRHVVCSLPPCDPEGRGDGGPCGNESPYCSCVTGGYCLHAGKCHCLKKFPDMVCDKANIRVQLSTAAHVNEGESIELTCHVNIPKADYSLQVQHAKSHSPHSRQELPENRTEFYKETNEIGFYKVVIYNATAEDTGTYLCIVSTTAGVLPLTVVDSAYVTVGSHTTHQPPQKPDQVTGNTSKTLTDNNSGSLGLSVAVALLTVGCILAIIALVAVKIRTRRKEQEDVRTSASVMVPLASESAE